MNELQSEITRLTMRVKAAEKLLVGFTAEDLAGNEVWALPAIREAMVEFWRVEKPDEQNDEAGQAAGQPMALVP